MGRNLTKTCYFRNVVAYTATSTSSFTTTGIDMSGYDGIVCWVRVTTATTAHALHAEANTNQSTSVTGYVDLEGTAVSASTSDEELMLDIYKPMKRYIRFVFDPSATAEVQFCNVLLYGAKSQPVENSVSGTRTAEFHVSPSTGTA